MNKILNLVCLFLLLSSSLPLGAATADEMQRLWSLRPVARPEIPLDFPSSKNPIDAFVGRLLEQRDLKPLGPASKETLLRRVYFDLIGLPPTPAELDAFLNDPSPDAYEKVVDRLLQNPQHGVRYSRHWLDVLRYADVDDGMVAESGIHLWRDWMISALNRDVPFDQFVRAQIAGDLSSKPDELFATGFLARGAQGAADPQEDLAFSAVETISSAFLAMTVGCAKCHDHFFDPIAQRDYFAMKALFDPLAPDKKVLATADQVFENARALERLEVERKALQARMDEITDPYYPALFEDRLQYLPPEVATIYRKPEKERTPEEQDLADNYQPNVRIDPRKFRDVMKPDEIERYEAIRTVQTELTRDPPALPVFWTVKVSPERLARKSHIYLGGDRESKGAEVEPGFPFEPEGLVFKGDRRQVFLKWLTAPENPLFARVAVNRIWQWHFGQPIVPTPSDFGFAGKEPTNPELLDWLASEFVANDYSMKALHRMIVTSDAYMRDSAGDASLITSNQAIDPNSDFLWKFRLLRLDAESVRDAVLYAAGDLDTSIGGRSFRAEGILDRRGKSTPRTGNYDEQLNRRAIYMGRGHHSSMDMMPRYLEVFDGEDGQAPCPMRARTVTAPQTLLMYNSDLTHEASKKLSQRLREGSSRNLRTAVEEGYKIALGRAPSGTERDQALTFLQDDPERLESFAWMLLNLSEFMFVR